MLSKVTVGLAGAVIAAFTGAFIFWGSPKKRQKDKFPGLVNVGNSCFLNAVLQAWAACPSLYTWLHSLSNRKEGAGILTDTVLKVLRVLNNEDRTVPDPYNPSEVFHALRAKNWVITAEEQDSHELYHVLTETLEEEASRYPSILSLFDVKNLHPPDPEQQHEAGGAYNRSHGQLPPLPHKQVLGPTRGLTASQLHCLSCGYRPPVKYDNFDSISLSFPHNYWGPLSVEQLLHQYIKPEIVQDVECQGCAKIAGKKSVKSNFRKKVSLGKLPGTLCLHLPRTQWTESGTPTKCFSHVSFPSTLFMQPFLHAHVTKTDTSGSGDSRKLGLAGGANGTLIPFRPRSSAPVTLLRTLHLDKQLSDPGLFSTSGGRAEIPKQLSDINHNAKPSMESGDAHTAHTEGNLQTSTFSPPQTYRLAAVVCHLGGVGLGHFVTYRRGIHSGGATYGASGLSNKWWFASDGDVHRVSSEQVHASEAYMLMYERV